APRRAQPGTDEEGTAMVSLADFMAAKALPFVDKETPSPASTPSPVSAPTSKPAQQPPSDLSSTVSGAPSPLVDLPFQKGAAAPPPAPPRHATAGLPFQQTGAFKAPAPPPPAP